MIDGSRRIERMFFNNPTINAEDYPPLEEALFEIQEMESMTFDYSFDSLCYIYVRDHNERWFVDVYCYYASYEDNIIHMKRFVIVPGCQMTEKDEENFFAFVNSNCVMFNTRTCRDYIKKINYLAPDIHIKTYKDIGLALFHTYYASFRSGIRELLLKAGLEYIAIDLSYVDGWNIIARNIEDAFGVPIKLLRKLNYHGGIEKIVSGEQIRDSAVMVYKKFNSILNDVETINEFQIYYMNQCADYERSVDKKLLRELADLESGWDPDAEEYINGFDVYNQLMEYQELCNEVGCCKTIFPRYPSLAMEDMERFYETYRLLRSYIEYEEKFDERMRKYYQACIKYVYENSEYEIIAPSSIKDILEESECQHNCLYQYVMEIIEGRMTVLFMRNKAKRKKSLVTIEIDKGVIKQARAACNHSPAIKEMEFIDAWAKVKGLKYHDYEQAKVTQA